MKKDYKLMEFSNRIMFINIHLGIGSRDEFSFI